MKTEESDKMRQLYKSWSNESLIHAITVDKNYLPEALELMEDELKTRNISHLLERIHTLTDDGMAPTCNKSLNDQLMDAICICDSQKVKTLLSGGADANSKTSTGSTPMNCAISCFRGEQDLIIIHNLLTHGADKDQRRAVRVDFSGLQTLSHIVWEEKYKGVINLCRNDLPKKDRDLLVKCLHKYRIYDPANPEATSGCFIATVCYGSPYCSEILTLQQFRDKQLMKSHLGRMTIALYNRLSPSIAKWMQVHPLFRRFVRKCLLDPIVQIISRSQIHSEVLGLDLNKPPANH